MIEQNLKQNKCEREYIFIQDVTKEEFQKVKEEITLFFKKRAFGTFDFIIYTIIVLTIIGFIFYSLNN